MVSRPIALLAPLLGIALAFLAPNQPREVAKVRGGGAAAAVNPYGAWGSPRRLSKHMADARAWAGESLKRGRERLPFRIEVEAIVGDPAQAARVIQQDYAKALAVLGAKDPAARAALATRIAGHVPAVYDPQTGTIHVLPENVQRAAEAAGMGGMPSEDVLRLFLVRMGIVALMRQHVPEWKAALDGAESLDALHCAAAVFQGRAMVQARRVAGVMNEQDSRYALSNADELVKLLTAPAAPDATPDLKAFVDAAKFAVVQGEKFMSNLPRTYHERVLKDPPTSRSVIFDPAAFTEALRAEAKRGPVKALPGKVHAAFVKAFMDEGAWTHEAADMGREDLEALVEPIEKRFTSTQMAAFTAGWSWRSAPEGETEGPRTDVWLVEMRSAAQAEALLSLLRGAAKQRGASLEDGAGRDFGLKGFHGHETVEDETWHTQWVAEGNFVVGFRTTRDLSEFEDHEPYDEVMEIVAEDVAKVAGSRDSKRRRKGR